MSRTLPGGLATLLLVACVEPVDGRIGPFDGRTNVDLREPLVVHGGATQIPPEYPAGSVITVVDLQDGGFVDGTVVTEGQDVLFHPADGWASGRRFAWSFLDPEHVPHGPEMPVDDALAGTAVVSTEDAPEVLAVEENDRRPCLVLSQVVDDAAALDLRVTVDDVDVDAGLRSVDQEWDPYESGATAICLDAVTVLAGQSVRVWIGDRGPWRNPAEAHETIVARMYREVTR